MRLMYIRYAGDFLADYKRIFLNNGKENYYGQKYSIETVLEQENKGIDILDLSIKVDIAYDEVIRKRLRVVGLNGNIDDVHKIIDDFSPDKVILRTPNVKLLKYLRLKKIPTFPLFADSFSQKPLYRVRSRINNFNLAKELNHKSIDWVANHQLNASKSLMEIGVTSTKILPYDWLHSDLPENWLKSKKVKLYEQKIKLFYAGQLTVLKGVYDLIDSVSIIKSKNRSVNLKIAGNINEKIKAEILNKNLTNEIELLGKISHDQVLENMHHSHLVIVPSHYDYPEGLPMTIMEGLMTNTPVIASAHPMFVGRCDRYGAVAFFQQKNSVKLAEKILAIMSDDETYWDMQKNTANEWHNLVINLKFAEMINAWIEIPNSEFLQKNSLHNKYNT